MKIYIPLKDILLGPGKRFDPSVNSEAEVKGTPGSGLGAALKAAYLAGESPVPGIAYLPG